MIGTGRRSQLFVLAAFLLVLAGACKKSKPVPKESEPPAAKVDSWIAHLPGDGDFVASISLEEFRGTSFWELYAMEILTPVKPYLAAILKDCKIDAGKELDRVLVSLNSERSTELNLILHGIKRARVVSCIDAMNAAQGKKISSSDEKALTLFKNEQGEVVQVLAWIDDWTFLTAPNRRDPAWFSERVAGERGLTGNKAWMKQAEKVDRQAALWLAAAYPAETPLGMGAQMATGGIPSRGFYGHWRFVEGLQLKFGMHFEAQDKAVAMKQLVEPSIKLYRVALGSAGSVMDKAKLDVKVVDLIGRLDMNPTEMELFAKEFGPTFAIGTDAPPPLTLQP